MKIKAKKCIICGSMLAIIGVIQNPRCDKCRTMHYQPDLPSEMLVYEQLLRSVPTSGIVASASVSTLELENLKDLNF
jgi:hypothetical protein